MTTFRLAAFGWLVPGGAYLLMRRYLQFAIFAVLVSIAFVAGILLQGGTAWPQPAELSGLDGFTALVFRASIFAKALTGAPYLLARVFDSSTFLASRLHEQGATLLMMAGVINVLAISSAIDLKNRKEATR
jgi:hypothetical protein